MFVPISNDDVIFTLIYKAIPGKFIRLLCVLIFLDIKFVMFMIIYIYISRIIKNKLFSVL